MSLTASTADYHMATHNSQHADDCIDVALDVP